MEYALHLGVSGLALEMMETKPIYIAREEYDGTKVIMWCDVTDYESNERRRFQSPLLFLTMYNIEKIDNPYFQGLLFSGKSCLGCYKFPVLMLDRKTTLPSG